MKYRYWSIIIPIIILLCFQYKNLKLIIEYIFKYSRGCGMVCGFLLSALGSTKGILSISKALCGTSILNPGIYSKTLIGCLICEANLIYGVIIAQLIYQKNVDPNNLIADQLLFAPGFIVGICSYYSSVAVGIICSSLTIIDAKDRSLFSKLIVLEIFAGTIGVIGGVVGLALLIKV